MLRGAMVLNRKRTYSPNTRTLLKHQRCLFWRQMKNKKQTSKKCCHWRVLLTQVQEICDSGFILIPFLTLIHSRVLTVCVDGLSVTWVCYLIRSGRSFKGELPRKILTTFLFETLGKSETNQLLIKSKWDDYIWCYEL